MQNSPLPSKRIWPPKGVSSTITKPCGSFSTRGGRSCQSREAVVRSPRRSVATAARKATTLLNAGSQKTSSDTSRRMGTNNTERTYTTSSTCQHPAPARAPDQILVYAETLTALRKRAARLKEKISAMGCTINEAKSEYSTQQIQFCGLHLGAGLVGPTKEKIQQILLTPAPTTKKDAQSALGLVSYLRDFIPLVSHFTSILYPDKTGLRLSLDDYRTKWADLWKT
jgi:hypothetical protein